VFLRLILRTKWMSNRRRLPVLISYGNKDYFFVYFGFVGSGFGSVASIEWLCPFLCSVFSQVFIGNIKKSNPSDNKSYRKTELHNHNQPPNQYLSVSIMPSMPKIVTPVATPLAIFLIKGSGSEPITTSLLRLSDILSKRLKSSVNCLSSMSYYSVIPALLARII